MAFNYLIAKSNFFILGCVIIVYTCYQEYYVVLVTLEKSHNHLGQSLRWLCGFLKPLKQHKVETEALDYIWLLCISNIKVCCPSIKN